MENGIRRGGSLYLVDKDKYEKMDEFFPDEEKIPLSGPLELGGYAVIFNEDADSPSWGDALRYAIDVDVEVLSQRCGSLIFIKFKGHGFIISFGTGWQNLKINWYVLNFGKLIALNTIPFDQLSALKLEQVMSTWHLSDEKSPLPTSASQFDMESDRDLVHALAGKPSPKYLGVFGSNIKGGDALHFAIDFKNLKSILDHALERFNSSEYKDIWPQFNFITAVMNQTLIDELNKKLDESFVKNPRLDDLFLVAPLLKKADAKIPTDYWIGRKPAVKKGAGRPSMPYLYPGSWKTYLEQNGLSACCASARSTPVHLYDENGNEIQIVTIYNCLCVELSIDNKSYFLSSGNWYETSERMIETTTASLKLISKGNPDELTAWDETCSEEEYNKECCKLKKLWLFDRKLVNYGGGASKFEFCDIYDDKTNKLYFVKNVRGSSQFSHFSEQVQRTVDLVFSPDGEFRKLLIDKAQKAHPKLDMSWANSRPKRGNLKICLVSMGKGFEEFPFFAKLSLVKLHRHIENMGHDFEFIRV